MGSGYSGYWYYKLPFFSRNTGVVDPPGHAEHVLDAVKYLVARARWTGSGLNCGAPKV